MIDRLISSWQTFVHLWYYIWPFFLIAGVVIVAIVLFRRAQRY